MNANSKKLLSLLIVVAMVLAMAPAITLPAAASTIDDIDDWIQNDFDEANLPTKCPVCGNNSVTWTALSGEKDAVISAAANSHYYLSDTLSSSANDNTITTNGQLCLYLNGNDIENTAKGRIIRVRGNTVNVFGDGNVTTSATNTAHMFEFNGTGKLNIYGGNYTYTTGGTAKMFEEQGTTTLYRGTFNQNPSSFTTVRIGEGAELADKGDGTYEVTYAGAAAAEVPLPDGGQSANKMSDVQTWQSATAAANAFDGDAVKAYCPICWAEVNWTPITSGTISATTDGEHKHYYLDVGYTETSGEFLNQTSTTSDGICLYLNDQTLTVSGRITIRTRLNVIGGGKIIRKENTNPLFDANGGDIYFYGGEYISEDTAWPMMRIRKDTSEIGVYEGSFTSAHRFFSEKGLTAGATKGTLTMAPGVVTTNESGIEDSYGNNTVTGIAAATVNNTAAGCVTTWCADGAAAMTAYEDGGYIKMYADGTLDLGEQEVTVDCNGKTVNVSNGTLKGYDSADVGTYSSAGKWVLGTGAEFVNQATVDGNRYVTLYTNDAKTEAKSYCYKLNMTAVSLRTGVVGLYYKTTVACGTDLAAKIDAYGVVLSLNQMPKSTFVEDALPGTAFTSVTGGITLDAETNSRTFTSGILKNIMVKDDAENQDRAEAEIYANAYLQIGDVYIMAVADEEITNTQDPALGWSLQNVMEAIDAELDTTYVDYKDVLGDFYATWEMNYFGWALDNIADYVDSKNA